MTTEQIETWGNLLKAYDAIRKWARDHPNGDIVDFLAWQLIEAQRAYALARRENAGERR